MSKKRANGEGSIRKRKDGRWEGRYTAGYDAKTGKRIIKNVLGKTQAEVKEKLKKALEECQRLDVSRTEEYTVPPGFALGMSSMPNQMCVPPQQTGINSSSNATLFPGLAVSN